MIINNNAYWNKYYKTSKLIHSPSNFAKYINKKFLKKGDIVLDVASGNGRDSFFFSNYVKFVYGIDKAKIVTIMNTKKAKTLNIKNLIFKTIPSQKMKKFRKKVTFIYARFFIHAIREKTENIFLNDIDKYFGKNIKVALEFRTIEDSLMNKGKKISKNETFYTHYIRFIDLKVFEKKIKEKNFKILYKKKGINLSKNLNENPYLCRLIIQKC